MMEIQEEQKLKTEMEEKILQICKDFLTRVAKIDELGSVGTRLLSGFQQGLELLRRAPINRKSELIESIIKANETERVKRYMAAGCINNHDSIQNLSKSKTIINELESLLVDLTTAINSSKGCFSPLKNEDLCEKLDQQAMIDQEETLPSGIQELKTVDYAVLMGIIYSMVKQDYVMQKKIVTSLNLKSSPGELESYCLMWSLRPFVNDEIMNRAWSLTH